MDICPNIKQQLISACFNKDCGNYHILSYFSLGFTIGYVTIQECSCVLRAESKINCSSLLHEIPILIASKYSTQSLLQSPANNNLQ